MPERLYEGRNNRTMKCLQILFSTRIEASNTYDSSATVN
jgi:hypothetical protein